MSKCRYCGQKIDWVAVGKINYPVDPDYVEYEDLENGQSLLTDGGNKYHYDADRVFPNVRGRLIHHDTCPKQEDRFKELMA